MTALSVTHPTLLDVAKRLDPDGDIDRIVEILNLTNEIIDDAVFVEANQMTGHRTTARTGIPTPTWRKLYGGVQPTKSTTVQVTDSVGMLEAYAEVDKALADLNSNTAAFRQSEEIPHIEGMNEEFASTLMYGNESTEPEAFTGFAPRFNSLAAENGDNIVNAGGSADCTSIWLVVWGPNTVHGIYPKGSKAGLSVTDKGQVTIEDIDGSGGRMEAYRSHFKWDCGLSVRDWRFIVRIANIDVGALTPDASGGVDLFDVISQALEIVPSLNMGRPVLYCNRTIKSFLRRQAKAAVTNSTLTMDMLAGKRVMAVDGIPVRRVDAIHSNETAVA
jgi:hypothetical protein